MRLSPLASVGLSVVIGASVAGYFAGTRGLPEPTVGPAAAAASAPEHVAPARTYRELAGRPGGPNAAWRSDLSTLRRPGAVGPVQDASQRAAALAARARTRAYAGAPPVIPHRVDQRSATACLACHGTGVTVTERAAPPIPHPPYAACLQCHVENVPGAEPAGAVPNGFVGLAEDGGGLRAWPGAPPEIPHPTWMRDRCTSCHGEHGRAGMQTTHPERGSCTQCHAPTHRAGGPPRLP